MVGVQKETLQAKLDEYRKQHQELSTHIEQAVANRFALDGAIQATELLLSVSVELTPDMLKEKSDGSGQ